MDRKESYTSLRNQAMDHLFLQLLLLVSPRNNTDGRGQPGFYRVGFTIPEAHAMACSVSRAMCRLLL